MLDTESVPDADLTEADPQTTSMNRELEAEILSGPAMVAFVIPLMTPVGIVHGSTVNMQRDETVPWLENIVFQVSEDGPELPLKGPNNRVSLKFWRPKRSNVLMKQLANEVLKVATAITGEPYSPIESVLDDDDAAGTVVEASTPLFDFDHRDLQKALSDAFDRSMEELSRLLRVIRIHVQDPTIPLVGRDSLPGGVIYIIRYGNNGNDILTERYQGILMVNLGHTIPSDVRDEVDVKTFSDAMMRYSGWMRGDPIFSAEDQFQRGMRARWVEADSQGAVIAFYTAIEIFCNGLLGLCQWESGGTRDDLVDWLENEGFNKRLRDRFHGFLGGNWDPKSSSSPIHALDGVAQVRHRVVHVAYEPTLDEVDNASEAYRQIAEFAKDRLVACRYQLPRTTVLVLGKPGLERKKVLSKKFQRLIDKLTEEEDWLATYKIWRQP